MCAPYSSPSDNIIYIFALCIWFPACWVPVIIQLRTVTKHTFPGKQISLSFSAPVMPWSTQCYTGVRSGIPGAEADHHHPASLADLEVAKKWRHPMRDAKLACWRCEKGGHWAQYCPEARTRAASRPAGDGGGRKEPSIPSRTLDLHSGTGSCSWLPARTSETTLMTEETVGSSH